MANEDLGPAERIINAMIAYSDHLVHNRPGMITADATSPIGVVWKPVTHKEEDGKKVVYEISKIGKKTNKIKRGELWKDNTIRNEARQKLGDYMPAGIFPQVAVWMYRQVAEVWKLNNEFAAKWASYAFPLDHKDLKVVLAAFMLCQSRKGDPVRENGAVAFHDEDYRDVGEAMILLRRKDKKDMMPKLLLRIHDLLSLPGIAEINRELGFGHSARKPFLGRWPKAVEKWLRHREQNPKILNGLVEGGYRQTVMELARRVGYKPETPYFFEVLRWKQKQADDGRRELAIGKEVQAAESWEDLTEEQICQRIVTSRPDYKRIVGLLPKRVGLTRAIVAAAIEVGSLSDKDLIILTPTLEELGLLQVQNVKNRWEAAIKAAEDMRAANIARNVKTKEVKDKLHEAADTAVQKAVEEQMKNIRIYFMVDISGSMTESLPTAKTYLEKFLQAFPPDRVHVAVFNTMGHEVTIKHASGAGIQNAFRGINAGGGTDHASGVRCLQKYQPQADEDTLFFFVGDEGEHNTFGRAVTASGLRPMAFGLVRVPGQNLSCVTRTAAELGVPCFLVDNKTFEDPYAIPRTIRALVAATPVGQAPQRVAPRASLVEQILKTDLLQKPVWA